MTEDGTYSDPRCATCGPPSLGPRPYHRGRFAVPNLNPPGWQEVDGVQLPPITWAERMASAEARYNRAMDRLADAVNARIPGAEIERFDQLGRDLNAVHPRRHLDDMLRNARAE